MSFSEEVAFFTDTGRGSATGRMQKVHREAALALFSAVIRDTNVQFGTLRANWIATEGAPSDEKIPNPTPGEGIMPPPDIRPTVSRARLKDKIYLTNNLTYAQYVEESRGMVKRNTARWGAIVRAAINRS